MSQLWRLQNKIKSIASYHGNNRHLFSSLISTGDRTPRLVWSGYEVQSVRRPSDTCRRLPHYCFHCGILGLAGRPPRRRSPRGSRSTSLSVPERPACCQYRGTSRSLAIMSVVRRKDLKRVCIIGSGNWGTAIAKIVGYNCARLEHFDNTVTMYVYEEMIDGKKLSEIINETHENIKYLPGIKLPKNVVAVPDLLESARDADILIFVVPHQFIRKICCTLLNQIKPTACALSLIKGFDRAEGGGIDLISHVIERNLHISCSVLMGANIASEVAKEQFCETTIGCKAKEMAPYFQDLMQTDNFRVTVVEDAATVEVCGALKNIVATGCGFADGMGLGDNSKAAFIRLGLMEMIKFVDVFYPGAKLSTFFESCGIADLITTCYGGRNRRIAEEFIKSKKTFEELEEQLLQGQKLQGPMTAAEVNYMLKSKNMEDRFPLMTTIHKICIGEAKPSDLITAVQKHPEHTRCAI